VPTTFRADVHPQVTTATKMEFSFLPQGKLARLTREGDCPTIPAWTAAASC